jgi:serine/threonine protein kinase
VVVFAIDIGILLALCQLFRSYGGWPFARKDLPQELLMPAPQDTASPLPPSRGAGAPTPRALSVDWMASMGNDRPTHVVEPLVSQAVPAQESSLPKIDEYEVLSVLGRGGMGVVYLAKHLRLKRLVALKMILHLDQADADSLARFQAEAQALAQFQHPNIVQIFDIGMLNGQPFMALEYVPGGSLYQHIHGTPQPPREAAALIIELAQAMQAAHEKGIVHRDLKPGNVLLAASDQPSTVSPTVSVMKLNMGSTMLKAIPKITDFGLAKRLTSRSIHTRTGDVIGTPNYMAPEQAAGDPKIIGPAVDIYSLGAILYELLTGRPPFTGVDTVNTLWQVMTAEPIPPRQLQPTIPRDLQIICLKCLEKEPNRRYLTAEGLAADLKRFLNKEPIRARAAGKAERTWRWCRRNPLLTGIILLAFFSLVSLTVLYIQAATSLAHAERNEALAKVAKWDAEQASKKARENAALAEENAAKAQEAVDRYLKEIMDAPGLKTKDFTARQLLNLAGLFALSAGLSREPSQQETLKGHALTFLRQVKAKGFFKDKKQIDALKADKAWEGMRSNAEFQKFMAEVEK